jgi:hypothetical protein
MRKWLEPGSSTFGIIVDGYEDTEHLPCLLTVSDAGQVTVSVEFPAGNYLGSIPSDTILWINQKPVPGRMSFLHAQGEVTLLGVVPISSNLSFLTLKTSRVTCDVEYALDGRIEESSETQLSISSLKRRFLDPKTVIAPYLHAIREVAQSEELGNVTALVVPGNGIIWEWEINDIHHLVREVSSLTQTAYRSEVQTQVEFLSQSTKPLDFRVILAEQQKLIDLLQIIHCKRIALIETSVGFQGEPINGLHELVAGRVRNSRVRDSSSREVGSIISIQDLSGDDILNWYHGYKKNARAITALSSLLPRIEVDAEEIAINSFIALETLAHNGFGLKFGRHVSELKAKDYVLKCLETIGLTSTRLADDLDGLAELVASNVNKIKHPRSAFFPDIEDTFFSSLIAQGLARAAALKQIIGKDVDWESIPEISLATALKNKEKEQTK